MEIENQAMWALTADGSRTLYDPATGEHYHSRHGAVGESRHVFIEMGLEYFLDRHAVSSLSVLEVGFGTGLNFLLSAGTCFSGAVHLEYSGVEANPLSVATLKELDYGQYVPEGLWSEFLEQYPRSLHEWQTLGKKVSFRVFPQKILDFHAPRKVDLIYFDAFSATHQPEMWSDQVLAHLADMMDSGGVFVTYAITGALKRSLKALDFEVEKLPGAPGKREMLRAVKK